MFNNDYCLFQLAKLIIYNLFVSFIIHDKTSVTHIPMKS